MSGSTNPTFTNVIVTSGLTVGGIAIGPNFTPVTPGLVPAPGATSGRVLSDNGTWAVPSTGSPGGTNGQVQYNNSGSFGGLTNAALTALINVFTSSLSGAVPSPGTPTGKFLSDAGTWATPSSASLSSFDWFNVMAYGAAGDGTTNDTAAINTATAAVSAAGGGVLYFPAKKFLFDPITVPANVHISGTLPGPFDPPSSFLTTLLGATFLVNSHGAPFITLGDNSILQDVLIFDPTQASPTASAPTAVPATIVAPHLNKIRRITICNGYIGIEIQSGRQWVDNCIIGAYSVGILVDPAQDFVLLSNIVQTVIWDTCQGLGYPQNIDTSWTQSHSIAYQFKRLDGGLLVNCGTFGRYAGMSLVDSGSGNSYGVGTNLWFDSVAYGIVTSSTNFNGWTFSNMWITQGANAQTAIWCQSGGAAAPRIQWQNGAMAGTFPFGAYTVDAGQCIVKGVNGIPDFGSVGVPASSGISLPFATGVVLTSVVLLAGTYLISGIGGFNCSGIIINQMAAGASTLPGAIPPTVEGLTSSFFGNFGPSNFAFGPAELTLTTETSVYLNLFCDFSGGPVTGFGELYWQRI